MASFFGPGKLNKPLSKFEKKGSSFVDFIKMEYDKQKNNTPRETKIHGYQMQAVLNTKKHFDEALVGNAPPALIVTPPGSGKTGMVVMIPYALQCKKVLIISPSTTISRQLSEAFGHDRKVLSFFETTIPDKDCFKAIQDFLECVTLIHTTPQVLNQKMGNLVIVNAQVSRKLKLVRSNHLVNFDNFVPEIRGKIKDIFNPQ
jgi:predicted helicase